MLLKHYSRNNSNIKEELWEKIILGNLIEGLWDLSQLGSTLSFAM